MLAILPGIFRLLPVFNRMESMYHHVDVYLNFLAVEKGVSLNTLEAYSRDLTRYVEFIEQTGIKDIREISSDNIISFLGKLKDSGLATISINRSLAAIRGFYKHLLTENIIDENPVANIELAKVWMHLPDTLGREEMALLLKATRHQKRRLLSEILPCWSFCTRRGFAYRNWFLCL